MRFEDIKDRDELFLYAGDLVYWNDTPIEDRFRMTEKKWIGLTIPVYGNYGCGNDDENHIPFDLTNKMPLDDNTVDIFQSEDVHEHIYYELLTEQINDIYRVLKPEGLFRLSVPDYNCDILYNRTQKDDNGNLMFDPGGGGYYDADEKKVKGNGHGWFPDYQNVKQLLESTKFKNINFLHYWIDRKEFVIKEINYKNGYIHRTPDYDQRVKDPRRPMSIVVDCYK